MFVAVDLLINGFICQLSNRKERDFDALETQASHSLRLLYVYAAALRAVIFPWGIAVGRFLSASKTAHGRFDTAKIQRTFAADGVARWY